MARKQVKASEEAVTQDPVEEVVEIPTDPKPIMKRKKLSVEKIVDEAIKRLEGIKCGPRPTSCPDQLANALKSFKNR